MQVMNMIRLLVVEDEAIERNYLVRAISALDEGIDEVLEASDGLSGLSLFEQKHPDIVIADIVMPMMDGLEMLCRIKEQDPGTVCFILSSYNSFYYARKALQMGIDDFLAKPCPKSELRAAIEKAVGMVCERHNKKSADALLEDRFHSFECHAACELIDAALHQRPLQVIRDNLHLLEIEESDQVCGIVLSSSGVKTIDPALTAAIRGLGCRLLINPRQNTAASLPDALLFAQKITSSLLEKVTAMMHTYGLQARFTHTCQALDLAALFQPETVKPVKSAGKADLEQAARLFVRDFRIETDDILQTESARLLLSILDQTHPFESLAAFAAQVQQLMAASFGIQLHFDFIGDLNMGQISLEQCTAFVLREMRQQMQEAVKRRTLAQKNSALDKTYRYIEERFDKPISLQSISQEMNISPYYLSRILNRETGESFTDLVNRFRIEEAKKQIRQGKSIKEASWNAGFSYQNYFSKVFKKITDLSPREYRSLFR